MFYFPLSYLMVPGVYHYSNFYCYMLALALFWAYTIITDPSQFMQKGDWSWSLWLWDEDLFNLLKIAEGSLVFKITAVGFSWLLLYGVTCFSLLIFWPFITRIYLTFRWRQLKITVVRIPANGEQPTIESVRPQFISAVAEPTEEDWRKSRNRWLTPIPNVQRFWTQPSDRTQIRLACKMVELSDQLHFELDGRYLVIFRWDRDVMEENKHVPAMFDPYVARGDVFIVKAKENLTNLERAKYEDIPASFLKLPSLIHGEKSGSGMDLYSLEMAREQERTFEI